MTTNILKEFINNIDDNARLFVISYFNEIIKDKYKYFKDKKEYEHVYKNLIYNDPFYNDEYNNYTNKSENYTLYQMDKIILSLPDAIKLIKQWIEGSCDKMFYVDGYVQEFIYSGLHSNENIKKMLLRDDKIITEYLNKGAIIITIDEANTYYLLCLKTEDGKIGCITNLTNGFLNK
jgi:hypothetical protein